MFFFFSLVADSRPVSSELATFQKEADDLHTVLLQFIEESLSLHITRIIESGIFFAAIRVFFF